MINDDERLGAPTTAVKFEGNEEEDSDLTHRKLNRRRAVIRRMDGERSEGMKRENLWLNSVTGFDTCDFELNAIVLLVLLSRKFKC